jgi:ribosomal protein L37E
VLATKHRKEAIVQPPFKQTINLQLLVPTSLDTDLLGTFSGEIERRGTPREVAVRKARLGMEAMGLPLGLASEGSFGPHPQIPFAPIDHELLVFIDLEMGLEIVEEVVSMQTNYAQDKARASDDLTAFLTRAQFPAHALIVRPNSRWDSDLIFKGITTFEALSAVVARCAALSDDGFAHIETDMRAHLNPSRQQVIQQAALQLARRLASLCPTCGTPGWGRVGVVRGLPCEWCGRDTHLVREEIYGCARCDYRDHRARSDGLQHASPADCAWCNP